MRIAKVEATWLHVPLPAERQHRSDFGHIKSFDTAVLRIETACGLIGWGEGKNAAGSAGNYGALVYLLNTELGPRLIGRDPRDIVPIWESAYNGVRAGQAAARGHIMPEVARSGLTIAAISAVDIALWDLLGKSVNLPVWRLLGGSTTSSLPAYASGGWAGVDGIGDELAGYVVRGGFKSVKMRVGSMDRSVQASAARVIAARQKLGPDIDIMCDAHGTYTLSDAKRFCHLTRDCNLAWFEEPVVVEDRAGLADLRRSTSVPIAAGESEYTRFAFLDLLDRRAVDILQPDMAICGGITEGMRIAALASSHNVQLAPHMWLGAPGFAAGLQVVASSPAGFIVEYSLGANPVLHDLIQEKFEVVEGCLDIPDRPGLGITVREDFVREYRRAGDA